MKQPKKAGYVMLKQTLGGCKMSCAACQEEQNPFNLAADDIQVIFGQTIRPLGENDWRRSHKLLLFIPAVFTPVCTSELGAVNDWVDHFWSLDCELIICGTDPAQAFVDWFEAEPKLQGLRCRVFSSYQLPKRLGLINKGRAKRASVFITSDGEVVRQEHFDKVGRSFEELHRQLYGYTTGSYCTEGWQSPVQPRVKSLQKSDEDDSQSKPGDNLASKKSKLAIFNRRHKKNYGHSPY